MTRPTAPDRTPAAAVVVLAGIAFVLVAAWLVPWSPVPGGTPDPVSADSAFTASEIAAGEHYAFWTRVWSWTSLAIQLVVVCGLGSARVRDRLTGRLPGPWWVQVPLAVVVVTLVLRVLALPFAVALQQHRLDHALSTQSWWGYARDQVTGLVVSIVVTSLGVLVLVGLARRWQRAWVLVGAGLAAALVLVGSLVYPVVVEPLYNSFTPLPDGPLRTGVLEVADREGVPVDDVLVADASRRTTTLNAYVSGFSGTRRVVLYDTLVDSLPEDQALSVVAHELAHARHDDVLTGTVLGALGAALGVGLLGMLVGGDRMRRASVVPLVMALLAVGSQLASPVENGISRRIETRADVDALKATGDPVAFREMQLMLARRSLADPTPPAWSQWWWGSHPTVLQRLALARD
ncbi:STE24 endopeptidase [Nocardioides sp. BE266]|uniref:M48 family metallopeptidase n=1 Tax=Nocardioides sp. BE266 TaxID=2817725 RepID=UPI00285A0171|nr:M48 family metallopeptidase [Nocardioides sp. BE266]MDR7253791.1 STE24 endopeptidase [Nocardioides sp. BE266]